MATAAELRSQIDKLKAQDAMGDALDYGPNPKIAQLQRQLDSLTVPKAATEPQGTTTPTTSTPATGGATPSATAPITSKVPAASPTSGIPNNLGIQTQEQQVSTRSTVTGSITDPSSNIPESAKQTYIGLETGQIAGGDQFQDPTTGQIKDYTPVQTAKGTTEDASVTSASAAVMTPSTVTGQTPVVDAAQTAVDKLVDPVTGKLTKEATAAQGIVDPAALVEAATSRVSADGIAVAQTADLPTKATMIGQLDGLLKELEGGSVPQWARPAVTQVEDMLARRGLSKSSIGRDALFNAIIQAALPIAQNDANAEAQRASQNLSNEQQTALFNASNVMKMDMANLSNEQQARLMNSSTIQTMTLTNLNNRQQAAMTNAANWAAMDTANLSAAMTAQVENARNFLNINLANLTNEQQANLVNQQSKLQTLMGDQAATNAARQFNAANETQVSQFMAQMGTQVSTFNATQANAMSQYNAGQENSMEQFNEQVEYQREAFNASMYTQIEQSNVNWRRQINQIDTAGENAVNQANAINAFNLSNQALTLAWQDLRDSVSWAFQAGENDQEKDVRLAIAALSSENEKANLTASAWQAAGTWVAGLFK